MGGPTAFGEAFKRRRVELRLTLRAFCRKTGMNPGNVSRLERGLLAPPADEQKLAEYARLLEIPEGSRKWKEFIELGMVCAGHIPDKVMADDELVKHLPLLFRTCTGRKPTREQLEEVIDAIRKA